MASLLFGKKKEDVEVSLLKGGKVASRGDAARDAC